MARPAAPRVSQHANFKVFIDENLILPKGNQEYFIFDLCAEILQKFITKTSSEIKKVVQIGCGPMDIINDYLSSKFKNIDFISNDLMEDLSEIHEKEFKNFNKKDNWQFLPGFQVDLLKEKKINEDLIYSKSILCAHSPQELNDLFKLYRENKFKFLLIAEKWYPDLNSFNIFKLDKPENIKTDKPYINNYYHHNYFEALSKNGYKILNSEANVVKSSRRKNASLNYYLFILAKLK